MLVLLPTLVALFSTAMFAVIAIRSRRSARSLTRSIVVPAAAASAARVLIRGVQFRMIAALVVGVLAAALVSALPIDRLGTADALAPGIGGAIGLLVIAVVPFRRRPVGGGLRQAELTPRAVGMFGPRWSFILPSLAAALLVLLLIATGTSAARYTDGLSRQIVVVVARGSDNSGGPYPGWFYGIPILAATAVLVGVVLIALHRIAAAPAVASGDTNTLDSALRGALTRFVMLASSAVVVLYLGAVSLSAGSVLRSASQWSHVKQSFVDKVCGHAIATHATCSFVSTPKNNVYGVVQPSYTVGAVGAAFGIVLIGVAILLFLLAVTNVVVRWSAVAAESEKVDA